MSAAIQVEPVWEDSGCYLLARIVGNNAANIVQADISSINLVITKKGGIPEAPVSRTVSTVVYDTLQTDGRWTVDLTGYNFRDAVLADDIDEPGTYFYEYKFTPVSGEPWHIVYTVPVLNLQRS